MNTNKEQPPPVATDRRPAWDIVIEFMESRLGQDGYGQVHQVVIADMRERDQVGRQRYGVPLTSGNGRDHLVDAYQEAMDFLVYLVAWLDERGVGPATAVSVRGHHLEWIVSCVQQMVWDQARQVLRLRAFIQDLAIMRDGGS